jgi:hypothetical protein
MRLIHTAPLAAAVLLAACGGDADDGTVSGDEVAAEAQQALQMRPGQYRTRQELLELSVPNADPERMAAMRQAFGEGAGMEYTYCVTAEDVGAGKQQEVFAKMTESRCSFSRFDVAGKQIDAMMQCGSGDPFSGDVAVSGTMEADRSDMTLSFKRPLPPLGEGDIKMKLTSERIGDCPA